MTRVKLVVPRSVFLISVLLMVGRVKTVVVPEGPIELLHSRCTLVLLVNWVVSVSCTVVRILVTRLPAGACLALTV